jgi:hypothetical protein
MRIYCGTVGKVGVEPTTRNAHRGTSLSPAYRAILLPIRWVKVKTTLTLPCPTLWRHLYGMPSGGPNLAKYAITRCSVSQDMPDYKSKPGSTNL